MFQHQIAEPGPSSALAGTSKSDANTTELHHWAKAELPHCIVQPPATVDHLVIVSAEEMKTWLEVQLKLSRSMRHRFNNRYQAHFIGSFLDCRGNVPTQVILDFTVEALSHLNCLEGWDEIRRDFGKIFSYDEVPIAVFYEDNSCRIVNSTSSFDVAELVKNSFPRLKIIPDSGDAIVMNEPDPTVSHVATRETIHSRDLSKPTPPEIVEVVRTILAAKADADDLTLNVLNRPLATTLANLIKAASDIAKQCKAESRQPRHAITAGGLCWQNLQDISTYLRTLLGARQYYEAEPHLSHVIEGSSTSQERLEPLTRLNHVFTWKEKMDKLLDTLRKQERLDCRRKELFGRKVTGRLELDGLLKKQSNPSERCADYQKRFDSLMLQKESLSAEIQGLKDFELAGDTLRIYHQIFTRDVILSTIKHIGITSIEALQAVRVNSPQQETDQQSSIDELLQKCHQIMIDNLDHFQPFETLYDVPPTKSKIEIDFKKQDLETIDSYIRIFPLNRDIFGAGKNPLWSLDSNLNLKFCHDFTTADDVTTAASQVEIPFSADAGSLAATTSSADVSSAFTPLAKPVSTIEENIERVMGEFLREHANDVLWWVRKNQAALAEGRESTRERPLILSIGYVNNEIRASNVFCPIRQPKLAVKLDWMCSLINYMVHTFCTRRHIPPNLLSPDLLKDLIKICHSARAIIDKCMSELGQGFSPVDKLILGRISKTLKSYLGIFKTQRDTYSVDPGLINALVNYDSSQQGVDLRSNTGRYRSILMFMKNLDYGLIKIESALGNRRSLSKALRSANDDFCGHLMKAFMRNARIQTYQQLGTLDDHDCDPREPQSIAATSKTSAALS